MGRWRACRRVSGRLLVVGGSAEDLSVGRWVGGEPVGGSVVGALLMVCGFVIRLEFSYFP